MRRPCFRRKGRPALRAWASAIMALGVLGLAGAASADTVSKAPDSVSVTIYRDPPNLPAYLRQMGLPGQNGLALIIETRTVDLPAGRTKLRFEGVADGIIPQSAAVEGLPGALVERDFDYDLLSPGALIAHLIDQPVRIVRTDRKTGAETSQDATLRAGPDGVVLQTQSGVEALHCSGGPERLVFDQLPAGLADRPTLSVVTDTPQAGRYSLRISYLSVRLNWSANYIARIHPDGDHLDLTGWITLANESAVSFVNAPTAVVAGRLARQPVDLPRVAGPKVETACWPMGNTHHGVPLPPPPALALALALPPTPIPMLMARIAVPSPAPSAPPAPPRVEQTDFGDYKLYSLVEPSTVAAHQTKQIQFLSQAGVNFRRVYRYDLMAFVPATPTIEDTQLRLRLTNKVSDGLGLPLPAGQVSLRQTAFDEDGRELFIAAPSLGDVPKDGPFELAAGASSGVQISRNLIEHHQVDQQSYRSQVTQTITAYNHLNKPAMVEIHAPPWVGLIAVAESAPHVIKGQDMVWTLPLPAHGQSTITLTLEIGPPQIRRR